MKIYRRIDSHHRMVCYQEKPNDDPKYWIEVKNIRPVRFIWWFAKGSWDRIGTTTYHNDHKDYQSLETYLRNNVYKPDWEPKDYRVKFKPFYGGTESEKVNEIVKKY